MARSGARLEGPLRSALPTRSARADRVPRRFPGAHASLTQGTLTVTSSRGLAAALKTGLAKGQWPAMLHLAAASQWVGHYATAAPLAPVLGQHPGEAAWITMASLFTLAASMSGVLFYMVRTTWEGMEPYVFQHKYRQKQDPLLLHGVDVSGSRYLQRPVVRQAAEFAAEAHRGQVRKTRQPYVTHCIETALIVEGLLSPTEEDERAEAAVVAALLHDVLDDTEVDVSEVEALFGEQVASMVGKVSQLSTTNQIVRRRLRVESAQPTLEEEAQLRNMILTMVGEPLVIAIKLADRLHNMRTVYALSPVKQQAVASETRRVWCSLAERLGMFALKSELEDLCFAVLQPAEYRALRRQLDELWGVPTIPPQAAHSVDCCLMDECECVIDDGPTSSSSSSSSSGDLSHLSSQAAAAAALLERQLSHTAASTSSGGSGSHGSVDAAVGGSSSSSSSGEFDWLTEQQAEAKELIDTVLPFDATTFNFAKLRTGAGGRRGLEVLQACAQLLIREVGTESLASGLEVSVQGRLKSMYSTFKKMTRKQVPLSEVYDARALRVVVDDDGGRRQSEAIAACYKLLPAVHRLFRRVAGEEDDYIALPKPSGYQSLHTAVLGPGGVPMEVQMRTSSMHSDAEYGKAAHWAYKETGPAGPAAAAAAAALASATAAATSSGGSSSMDDAAASIQVGQPMLHIGSGGRFRDGVVVQTEHGGKRLLCAIAQKQRRSPAARPASADEYRQLLQYVDDKGYFGPSQGDLSVFLELFTLCSDGKYHRLDRFGHKLPTVVVPLTADATCSTDNDSSSSSSSSSNAAAVPPIAAVAPPIVAAAVALPGDGPAPEHTTSSSSAAVAAAGDASGSSVLSEMEYMNNRIRLLRSMLEWGRELGSSIAAEAAGDDQQRPSSDSAAIAAWTEQQLAVQEDAGQDVMVLVWPGGKILRVPRGTTAGTVIRDLGLIEIQPPAAATDTSNLAASSGRGSTGGSSTIGSNNVVVSSIGSTAGTAAAPDGAAMSGDGPGGGVAPAPYRRPPPPALLVNVNNRLVPEETPLYDGDYVVLSRDKVKI